MEREAVIVAAARTPFARLDGELAMVPAETLAATVTRHLVQSAAIDPAEISDVIFATASGADGNLGRRAALDAGLPVSVPGLTIDRQCGGGLDAIVLACRMVLGGAGDLYVAGGTESASTSPLLDGTGIDIDSRGRRFFPRRMFSGGGYADPGMAESAETVATEWRIDRRRQDEFSAESHRRAVAAARAGVFANELVPCATPTGDVRVDSCPRPTLTAERIGRFAPIVTSTGTVTAANSCQIADGAAAVLVASGALARRLGVGGLRFRDGETAGVDPRVCGIGAVAAVRRMAQRDPRFVVGEMDEIAMTEAFAAQVIATADELGLDLSRVNANGGAIALGHPWAASGAMQVVRLFHDLRNGSYGLALAAIAGGMGTAAWFVADAG